MTVDAPNQEQFDISCPPPLFSNVCDILDTSGVKLLFYGDSGTSKSFLGRSIPNSVYVSCLELVPNFYEKFTQVCRKCIEAEIHEIYEVIQGVVVECTDRLVLKTIDMESAFEVDVKMMAQIKKNGVTIGDSIRINKTTGKFRILKDVEIQGGELCNRMEEVEKTTLHRMDMLGANLNPWNDEYATIPLDIRNEVNKNMKKMVKEGKAVIKGHKLVIDDLHLLNKPELLFIDGFTHSVFPISMLLISDMDLDISCIKLASRQYDLDQVQGIIKYRAKMHGIDLEPDAFAKLVQSSMAYGLEYTVNLMEMIKKEGGTIRISIIENYMELFKSC